MEEEEEEEGERRRRRREGEEVRWLCEKLGLAPRQLLVVTAEPRLVGVGRKEGCFTCLFSREEEEGGREGGRRGGEDYRVGAWEEVQGVIEDLNGVSFRQR